MNNGLMKLSEVSLTPTQGRCATTSPSSSLENDPSSPSRLFTRSDSIVFYARRFSQDFQSKDWVTEAIGSVSWINVSAMGHNKF